MASGFSTLWGSAFSALSNKHFSYPIIAKVIFLHFLLEVFKYIYDIILMYTSNIY